MVILHLLNGLTIGAILILLSSGLTVVYGLQGIINAAHSFFYMLGAYIGITIINSLHLSFWVSIPVAFILTFLLGAGLEISGIRLMAKWNRDPLHNLVLTIGFALVGQEVVKIAWGSLPQDIPIPTILQGVMNLGTITYPVYWLFVIGSTTLFMLALYLFFTRTGWGTLVQSIALNRELSQALGTNVLLISTITFGLGTGIAGVAGILAGPILGVDPNMAFELLFFLFVVIIFGGLGSLTGVVVSGLIIGQIFSFGTVLMTGLIAKILIYVVLIVILTFKPLGLFGRGSVIE